jgi:hypothetical protein
MTNLPDPIVPPEVDLTDFPFMPLDVRRLRDSKLATSADGEAFRAAVLLWCAAWHQLPAASLPDDDAELAQLAGFGRAVREWKKIRTGALYGWIKCSDGRLYHPVVAEKAVESWKRKQEQKVKTIKARLAAFEKRLKDATTEADKSQLQSLIQALKDQLPQTLLLTPKTPVTDIKDGQSQKDKKSVTDPVSESNREGQGQGEGYREGQGEGKVYVAAGKPTAPPTDETALQTACRKTWHAYQEAYAQRYGVEPVRNEKVNSQVKQFVKRLGFEESPLVASFFVGHSAAYYVKKLHDWGSLVSDAEKLRTEWKTGCMVTSTSAQQADRSQSNFSAANEAVRILDSAGATA